MAFLFYCKKARQIFSQKESQMFIPHFLSFYARNKSSWLLVQHCNFMRTVRTLCPSLQVILAAGLFWNRALLLYQSKLWMSFPAALMTAVERSCRWRFMCYSDGHGNGWKCLPGLGSISKLLCSCVFVDNPGVCVAEKDKNRCFVIYAINFLSAALCSDHMLYPPAL